MTDANAASSAVVPPRWAHCGAGTGPDDPVGCCGIHVFGHVACLAHLAEPDRAAYLDGLSPGSDIDHRGTPFTRELLDLLLDAVRDPGTGLPRLGTAWFDEASFTGRVSFHRVTFTGKAGFCGASFAHATFSRAVFSGHADFEAAVFDDDARFYASVFNRAAEFHETAFHRDAWFEEAAFTGLADFRKATFAREARFGGASFSDTAMFMEAVFTGDARFEKAAFAGNAAFNENANFNRAVFTGEARFRKATFSCEADFRGAAFDRDARFDEVAVAGAARFDDVIFSRNAAFNAVTFTSDAWFNEAAFTGNAEFDATTFATAAWFSAAAFTGTARFQKATFAGTGWFTKAVFAGNAYFHGALFTGDARFESVRFEAARHVGALVCGGTLELNWAVFGAPVTVQTAAQKVLLQRARWESTAALRLRYATVDLTGAVLEFPLTLTAEPAPFPRSSDDTLAEDSLRGRDTGVRISSVTGVDAAHLSLTDVDLSACRFAGAVHLDQLSVAGRVDFARPPRGWRRRGPLPVRFSRRQVLAEEHHWRAATARRPAAGQQPTPGDWQPGPHHPETQRVPGTRTVAALYRQLRKALEDGKNEPGAADFYYGECEMRRHDRTGTPWVERALLAVYWAVSGYGLRASRALAWLGVMMTATVAVMMLWGLPADTPEPITTGRQVQVGQELTLTTATPDPVNPTGPLPNRLTGERFEKSLRVVINSTVFRSSGQDLTTAGTYVEMASRFTEPVLLALAALAIRARVKR